MIFVVERLCDFFWRLCDFFWRLRDFFWWRDCVIFCVERFCFVDRWHDFVCGEVA